MIVLGLTGSIGMGKSTTANMFAENNVPVHDADAAVHKLYERGDAVRLIEEEFPGSTGKEGVDRAKLGKMVFNDAEAIKKLEAIVHPLVRAAEDEFLEKCRSIDAPLAVLDIPLLFEAGADKRVDKILVVTAPLAVQKERVLARHGMTEERFNTILDKQLPDAEKRNRADFVIDTSLGMEAAHSKVIAIIEELSS